MKTKMKITSPDGSERLIDIEVLEGGEIRFLEAHTPTPGETCEIVASPTDRHK